MGSKDQTRDAILQAAMELFDRFGPTKTSVADIARALGMSAANIYNFYASRDAIVEAAGELRLLTLRRQIEAEMQRASDEWESLTTLFLTTSRHIRACLQNEKDVLHLQVLQRRYQWRFIGDFDLFLRGIAACSLRRGMERGRFARMDPAAATAALFDCMVAATDPVLILRLEQADHEARLAAQLSLLERAFRPTAPCDC